MSRSQPSQPMDIPSRSGDNGDQGAGQPKLTQYSFRLGPLGKEARNLFAKLRQASSPTAETELTPAEALLSNKDRTSNKPHLESKTEANKVQLADGSRGRKHSNAYYIYQKHRNGPTSVQDTRIIARYPDYSDPDEPDIKPDVKIKSRYETRELQEAIKLAEKNHLPLVVHVGALWCGPCQRMEQNSWGGRNGVENDKTLNQKAVYLHLDVDQARYLRGPAGQFARKLQNEVEGYPTIKVIDVKSNERGIPSLTVRDTGGFMDETRLKEFLHRNLDRN